MKKLTKKRIFEIIQIGKNDDIPSRAFDLTVVFLIVLNLVVTICFTFDELDKYDKIFNYIEAFTVMFFTVELILRLWTAGFLYKDRNVRSAIKYLFSFNGVIEVLSIVPFFLPFVFPKGIVAFRMFRVIRILRLFQINSYSDALSTVMLVIRRKRKQLLSSMFIIFIIMIMSSLVMYGFEHEAQPEVFKNAFSGIWWATSTLLTVGYGDIYPVTILGKVASILITFLGVGMVAVPTGILSAGFTEYVTENRRAKKLKERENVDKAIDYCPYCGEKLPK